MRKRVLFVCTYNEDRSPLAEKIVNSDPIFRDIYEAKSAGFSRGSPTTLSAQVIEWADYIVVMDETTDKHMSRLLEKFPEASGKEVSVLGISYRDLELSYLQEMMKRKLEKILI